MNILDRMVMGLEPKPTKRKYYTLMIKLWFAKINPFNLRIFIYNKATLTDRKISNAAKLGTDGRYLFLLQDDGKPFRVQTALTLIDRVNEPTRAKVELYVDISEILNINNPS